MNVLFFNPLTDVVARTRFSAVNGVIEMHFVMVFWLE
jgi:hypothetical protein